MMKLFCCYAYFSINKIKQIEAIRPKHIEYIKSQKNIQYGGVITNEDDTYKGVLIIFYANDSKSAKEIIRLDPYFELYDRCEINNFNQKIPN